MTPEPAHTATPRVLVTPADGGGWDVRTTQGDGVVKTIHCEDWHHVEFARMMATLGWPAPAPRRGVVALVLLFSLGAVSGLASAQDRQRTPPEGFIPEPRVIARSINLAIRTVGQGSDREKNGPYPELSNMPTGAGWVSGGPGYRHWLFGDRLIVDASAAVSWRLYKVAQARAELTNLAHSRLAVGAQARWQDLTQVTYFGEGASSLETDRSEYRLRSSNVVGYATVRPTPWLSLGGRTGWLRRPDIGAAAGSFRRGHPDTREVFPDDRVFAREQQPNYAHGEFSIAADTRDHHSHPVRGALYRAAWSRYVDAGAGEFTFDRYEAEGAHFLPVATSRVVFALHGWLVASATGDGRSIPFYLLPGLGGANTLRSYADYRFHDRHLLALTAESRVALFTHLDAAVFVDAGNVAARLGDLNLDRTSIGAGLRLHTERATLARLDVAHGREGWRFLVRTNDPLQLSRLSRRTAATPFVP
jgi:hypothetical protein